MIQLPIKSMKVLADCNRFQIKRNVYLRLKGHFEKGHYMKQVAMRPLKHMASVLLTYYLLLVSLYVEFDVITGCCLEM